MQRLDKILLSAGAGTRRELRAAIRAGRVTVDGAVCRDESAKFDEKNAQIPLDGEPVELLRPALILLNKPAGYLTAADDPRQKTVMDLIPARYRRFGVMPVGRLDKDTEGLLLLTNDGNLAHRIISPKHGVWKTYYCEHDGRSAARMCGRCKGTVAPGWAVVSSGGAPPARLRQKRRARTGRKVPSGAAHDGISRSAAVLSQARLRRRALAGRPRAGRGDRTGYGADRAADHKLL